MAEEEIKPLFRHIGRGFCANIWAVDREGEAFALKRGDMDPSRSVENDSIMHQRIEKSYYACKTMLSSLGHLNIPRYQALVLQSDTEWWKAREARFPPPKDSRFKLEPCDTLISERIPIFEIQARSAIIDRFCPEQLKEVITSRREEEDCLIRPYLGGRSYPRGSFTLRNYRMTLQKLEEIALPIEDYARTMAEALAFMYWHAQIDANDVEFVLAPKGCHPASGSWHSDVIGEHTLWLLDFDQVKPMSLDDAGVEQAAWAFYKNGWYFPRPCGATKHDLELWDKFKQHFLRSSEILLGESALPKMLIDKLEKLGKERKERKAENERNVAGKINSIT